MIAVSDGSACVSGPVTLANVNAVLDEGRRTLTASEVTVDLSGVTEVDSTCVSLLLEWRQSGRASKDHVSPNKYKKARFLRKNASKQALSGTVLRQSCRHQTHPATLTNSPRPPISICGRPRTPRRARQFFHTKHPQNAT